MPSDIEATMPWEINNVSPNASGLKTVLNGALGIVVLALIFTLGLFGWNKAQEATGMDTDSRMTMEVR